MAHQLMLHGHPVGYLPPTYASEILTSGGDTVQEKLDAIAPSTETYSTIRFFISKPVGVAGFEAILPLSRKPTSVTISNLQYYGGSSWVDLSNAVVNIIDNGLEIGCTAPSGATAGLNYWGRANITLNY